MKLKALIPTSILEYLNEWGTSSFVRFDNSVMYYHGSRDKFDKFSNSQKDVSRRTGGDEYGYGLYLTPNKDLAVHYARGGYIYTVKIKSSVNIVSDDRKLSAAKLEKVRNAIIHNDIAIAHVRGHNPGIAPKQVTDHLTYSINDIIDDSKDFHELYQKIQRHFPLSNKQLSELMDAAGINGVFGNSGQELVIFNPLNIEILSRDSLS